MAMSSHLIKFSRHGYGLAWILNRLTHLPHDSLVDGPAENWELGTRDTGSYATMLEVMNYLDWLGGRVAPDAKGGTDLLPQARLFCP